MKILVIHSNCDISLPPRSCRGHWKWRFSCCWLIWRWNLSAPNKMSFSEIPVKWWLYTCRRKRFLEVFFFKCSKISVINFKFPATVQLIVSVFRVANSLKNLEKSQNLKQMAEIELQEVVTICQEFFLPTTQYLQWVPNSEAVKTVPTLSAYLSFHRYCSEHEIIIAPFTYSLQIWRTKEEQRKELANVSEIFSGPMKIFHSQ